MSVQRKLGRRPLALWIIFGGSIYVVLHVAYVILYFLSAISATGLVVLLGLLAGITLGGIGAMAKKRLALVVEIGAGLTFLAYVSPTIITAFSEPGNFAAFRDAYPITLGLVLLLVLSTASLLKFKEIETSRQFSSIYSGTGLLFVAVLFLIIGGLVVDYPLSQAYNGVLTNQSTPGAVSIPLGAANQGNSAGYYVPASAAYVIGVNNTVTWVNHDVAIHTVTSGTGAFDSKNIASGSSWSYTFSTPGTYGYHCTIHPWMTGTVIVR